MNLKSHTLSEVGNGYKITATYDPPTHKIYVNTMTNDLIHFKNVMSLDALAEMMIGDEDMDLLEKAIEVHKKMPEFQKIINGKTVAINSDQSLEIKITLSTPYGAEAVDVEKLLSKLKYELMKEVKAQPKFEHKKIKHDNHAKFHTGGLVSNYKPPSGFIGDYSNSPYVKELAEVFKGLGEKVKHPVTGAEHTLSSIVVNLNDAYNWSRNQIADWIEALDIDTSMVEGDSNDNTNAEAPA